MAPKPSQQAVSPKPSPDLSSALPLSAPPKDEQLIAHDDKVYTTVKEGSAYILIPPDAPRLLDPKTHASEPAQSVFYNPIQQYNRDLTVLAIRAFGEDYLARGALKRKRGGDKKSRKGQKQAEKVGGLDGAANNATSAGPIAEEQGTKRKVDEIQAEEAGSKRQRIGGSGEVAEFEDGGIDDSDLLAAEKSFRAELPSSAPTGPARNGENGSTSAAEQGPDKLLDKRPHFRVLDALSATGLRALRYAQELPFNVHVTANDLSKQAVDMIKLNVAHNKLEGRIKTNVGNANAHMYNYVGQEGIGGPGQKYQVIDLDPYGTAVPFLDAAVQATSDNGLLCVTCTDTGVFNSMGYAEKAFALYGGLPSKGDHCHEAGLRLILHAIASAAARYGTAIEPLLSLSIDYYARVFVRIRKSPAQVKFVGSKTMLVYTCDHGCGAWNTQYLMRATEQEGKKGAMWHKFTVAQGPTSDRLCECCGSKMHIAGPMWGGPLHNPSFIQRVLDLVKTSDTEIYKTLSRIEGMLSVAQQEMTLHDSTQLTTGPMALPEHLKKAKGSQTNGEAQDADLKQSETNGDGEKAEAVKDQDPEVLLKQTYEELKPSALDRHPFYFIPSSLSRVIHSQAPSDAAIRGALKGLGFQTVRSHTNAGTIKTDAPWETIWDVMYAWTKEKPIREGALNENMAGFRLLKKAEEREKAREDETKITKRSRKIVFDEALGRESPEQKRLMRYQLNPRANWGPMARAK